ncbi:Uncaracterized surface protein containing fasciclin (FAS1) repeats [Geodermatophilus pulveris]|uniref:Uncaracterized surface protein containing fasciclin (FAS1) repeats n=1 Tax=Geodermatophilus pulveris TaxID=1564159 RepID=A0A239I2T9_9ACTN|nr:fasciclin domain-containing protein [Geodermatophilus pulveris]SNS87588.1 Uncaracterized surface protein containing fasciclin (FAS1) repeats [Geodermatophilus pulveris]
MTGTPIRRTQLAAAAVLALSLPGCGSDEPAGDVPAASGAPTTATAPESTAPGSTAPGSAAPAEPTGLFGAGCAGLPAEGPGSPAALAATPAAAAMAAVPGLAGTTGAVRAASLSASLDATRDLTVLAPVNEAFGAVPPATLDPLLADTPRLTALVTHHVIARRLEPGELAGTHTTLAGGQVTVEGAGEAFTISADQTVLGAADARVICGNIATVNATVYVVDQVLTPPAG